jgi:tellurite resistance protein
MAAKKKQQEAKEPEQSARLDLEAHAQSIRDNINVPQQNELFRAAIEAAYLTALADGVVDQEELDAMTAAVELLSKGTVIEWEAQALIDDCAARAQAQGAWERIEAVGKELTTLGNAQAGLYVAAVVARASNGIDKREAEVLKSIGAAAGMEAEAVKEIVKMAGSL